MTRYIPLHEAGGQATTADEREGVMMSDELLEKLNKKMHILLNDAVARTKRNKRSAVRSHDLSTDFS